MQQFKGTPGPWRIAQNGFDTEVVGADSFEVTDAGAGLKLNENYTGEYGHWSHKPGVYFIDRSDDEMEANARLIAAAPELLEAAQNIIRLRELIEYPQEVKSEHAEEADAIWYAINSCKLAISKALGTNQSEQ